MATRKRGRSGRAKPEEEPESHWRATLFVWRGEVFSHDTHADGSPMLKWLGAWAPADGQALPSDATLEGSENTFSLETAKFDDEAIVAAGEAELAEKGIEGYCAGSYEIFEGLEMYGSMGDPEEEPPEARLYMLSGLGEMTFRGAYLLDQGDDQGPRPYQDDEHRWEVRCHAEKAAVAAVGTTPFGKFVSLGYLDGDTLTLARRYVADEDPRAAWTSPKDVLDAILVDGEPLAADDIPAKLPWKVEG